MAYEDFCALTMALHAAPMLKNTELYMVFVTTWNWTLVGSLRQQQHAYRYRRIEPDWMSLVRGGLASGRVVGVVRILRLGVGVVGRVRTRIVVRCIGE
jgi:hypothetical protein